ncbi:MAG: hypothetical protein K2X81_29205 [Candidatus Obscuribacterales bacterium]|nr:hypothetical protein [Candidatus Obscuribacterales bacterium]
MDSDESTFCAAVIMYNISFQSNCGTLADSAAIPMLVATISKGPILCAQLSIAALCNLSKSPQFHEQLSEVALASMVKVIASPQLHANIKTVSLYFAQLAPRLN